MLEGIGARVKVEETKKIGKDREKGREMVWVKLGSEEHKWKVMEKKRIEREKGKNWEGSNEGKKGEMKARGDSETERRGKEKR